MMPQAMKGWQTKDISAHCDTFSEGSTSCATTEGSTWSQSTLPEASAEACHDANCLSELMIELPRCRPSKQIPDCPKQACHDIKRLNTLAIELPRCRPSNPDRPQTSPAKPKPGSVDSTIRDIKKPQVQIFDFETPISRANPILSASLHSDMSLNALFSFLEDDKAEDEGTYVLKVGCEPGYLVEGLHGFVVLPSSVPRASVGHVKSAWTESGELNKACHAFAKRISL
eukprot:TRINITY_DN14496_c0_g1_i1.p1 TRINITY_DN14496_c0_g1~~TRINITY_DN14496_c0_g1_i1.p1  ORF type:complete len:228 (+),score=18.57 TRINITY_DN14496_c0_g1_i1:65-748(+)